MITDANGCSTSGTYTVSFAIGISAQSLTEGISLYPNPAHENFTIDAGINTVDKLEVMNVLGQVAYAAEPKTTKVQVSTDSFTPGIYFVRMSVRLSTHAGVGVAIERRMVDPALGLGATSIRQCVALRRRRGRLSPTAIAIHVPESATSTAVSQIAGTTWPLKLAIAPRSSAPIAYPVSRQ